MAPVASLLTLAVLALLAVPGLAAASQVADFQNEVSSLNEVAPAAPGSLVLPAKKIAAVFGAMNANLKGLNGDMTQPNTTVVVLGPEGTLPELWKCWVGSGGFGCEW